MKEKTMRIFACGIEVAEECVHKGMDLEGNPEADKG